MGKLLLQDKLMEVFFKRLSFGEIDRQETMIALIAYYADESITEEVKTERNKLTKYLGLYYLYKQSNKEKSFSNEEKNELKELLMQINTYVLEDYIKKRAIECGDFDELRIAE